MAGLGAPRSSSFSASHQRWRGRCWKRGGQCSWQLWGREDLHLEGCSGLSVPRATRFPPHRAPPPQNLPLRSPPGKNLAASGLSEQRDAPFGYHGNLSEKFLKFRQGNFSSPLRFRYRSARCSPGKRRPALLLRQQDGISEIRNAGAGLCCELGERVGVLPAPRELPWPRRCVLVPNERRGGDHEHPELGESR